DLHPLFRKPDLHHLALAGTGVEVLAMSQCLRYHDPAPLPHVADEIAAKLPAEHGEHDVDRPPALETETLRQLAARHHATVVGNEDRKQFELGARQLQGPALERRKVSGEIDLEGTEDEDVLRRGLGGVCHGRKARSRSLTEVFRSVSIRLKLRLRSNPDKPVRAP